LLKQPLVRGIIAEPTLATADQRLILGHKSVIDIILSTLGYGDGMLFRVFGVASAVSAFRFPKASQLFRNPLRT